MLFMIQWLRVYYILVTINNGRVDIFFYYFNTTDYRYIESVLYPNLQRRENSTMSNVWDHKSYI